MTPQQDDETRRQEHRALRRQQYERRQHALYMRRQGVTYSLIAAELGVSVPRAREIVKYARREPAPRRESPDHEPKLS